MIDLLVSISEMLCTIRDLIQQTYHEWQEKQRLSFGIGFCWLVLGFALLLIGFILYSTLII